MLTGCPCQGKHYPLATHLRFELKRLFSLPLGFKPNPLPIRVNAPYKLETFLIEVYQPHWDNRIRTYSYRVKVCCAAITQCPIVPSIFFMYNAPRLAALNHEQRWTCRPNGQRRVIICFESDNLMRLLVTLLCSL